MANTKKKIERTPNEQKAYNVEMAEKRKTNEFFVESSNKRTNAVLKALDRLAFMSRYNGTEEQHETVMSAIDSKVEEVRNTFAGVKVKTEFKL